MNKQNISSPQKILHKVKIVDGQVLLDDFAVRGVVGFTIKKTVTGLTRIKLEIDIKSSNLNVR